MNVLVLRKIIACGRRVGFAVALCFLFATAGVVASLHAPDQPGDDFVGSIEGDDISLSGPMRIEVVGTVTKTILRSGSDVRVNSGEASIHLVEGGQVQICGPAHFSVLKSGAAVTFALESGIMHALLESGPALTVYTPQIQAQPVAIGDEPRELLVGFESPTLMCVRTQRGALRLEEQLSGESVIVPQGGDVLLTNGRIDSLTNGGGHCNCDLEIAKAAPPPPPLALPPAAPAPATASERTTQSADVPVVNALAAAPEKPMAKDKPIYEVTMPPLVYDARAKVQPEPNPQLMVIVKRVQVRSELVFKGRVEAAPVAAPAVPPVERPASQSASPSPPPTAAPPAAKPAEANGSSVVDRVRSYWRHLWSKGS